MSKILSYKLYEGVFNDIKIDIEKKKTEISNLKEHYLEEVKNCLVDITDNWESDYFGYPRDLENDDSYGEYEIALNVSIKYNDINKFIDSYDYVSGLIKSYIGVDIKIESVYCEQNMHPSKFSFTEKSFYTTDLENKKNIFTEFIGKIIDSNKDLIEINFIIE